MADPLGESIATLCGALQGLRDQATALATVHAAIDQFNGVFGCFQNAMALHSSCLAFPAPPKPAPAPPPRATGIPKPQIAATTAPQPKPDARTSTSSGGRASDASSGPPAAPTAQPQTGKATAQPTKKRPSSERPSGAGGPAAAKKKAPTGKRPPKGRTATAVAAQKNARPETAPWKWDKNIRDNIPRKYQSEGELAKLENILLYLKNRHTGVTIADLVKHSGLAVIRCKEMLQTLTKLNLIGRKQENSGFLYTFGSSEY